MQEVRLVVVALVAEEGESGSGEEPGGYGAPLGPGPAVNADFKIIGDHNFARLLQAAVRMLSAPVAKAAPVTKGRPIHQSRHFGRQTC